MEKAFIRNKSLVIFIPLLLLSSRDNAQESLTMEYASPSRVKYISGDNNALFPDIKFDNKNIGTFKMQVFDETTDKTLFRYCYSTHDFEKKFKIPRLTGTDYVTFLIRSAKKNTQLSYKVKVTPRVVTKRFS
jgi:hypothetical protein